MNTQDIKDWLERHDVEAVSIKNDDEGESPESYFSMRGCDADPEGLGNEVYDCTALYRNHAGEMSEFDCALSNQAICFIYNGE